MHPKQLSINDFTYTLPPAKIAYYPLPERDESKLLIYQKGTISENIYRQLAQYISTESLLIFNNTKVVEARLLFQKDSGGVIEIFCLEPRTHHKDVNLAMQQTGSIICNCLIGGASKWKAGRVLEKKTLYQGSEITLNATYVEKINEAFAIELSWLPVHLCFADVLHVFGATPLPPYIKRPATDADAERYQTIYAACRGSVAAPTAGLHFTSAVMKALEEKKVKKEYVTLHVGAGTFKPVKATTLEMHDMHAEFMDVSIKTIEVMLENIENGITAVGTTSLRTVESLYWLGVKIILQPTISVTDLYLNQWDPYELPRKDITPSYALQTLISWLKENKLPRLITTTQILIAPGYSFKIINALITNLHQPQSTLLLLVAAFIGEDWKKIYQYALENNFRFLSYGDGCLLQRH